MEESTREATSEIDEEAMTILNRIHFSRDTRVLLILQDKPHSDFPSQ
jgi:hypothetical protein